MLHVNNRCLVLGVLMFKELLDPSCISHLATDDRLVASTFAPSQTF